MKALLPEFEALRARFPAGFASSLVLPCLRRIQEERGYVADIKLTVKGGLIGKIDYNEANKGKTKWTDKSYNESMKKMAGVSWIEAVQALEKDLIAKQDPAKVDVVSGATELSVRFKGLAAQALSKAK